MLLRPFESMVLYTLRLLLGSFWKRSEPTYTLHLLLYTSLNCRTYTLQLLLWSLWKQSTYTMQLLLGALVSRVPAHYNCCWGPLWKQSSLLAHCSCFWWPHWRQNTDLWCGSENIIWADNKFFTKNEEYIRTKYLEGDPRQVSRLPYRKHTTVYNPGTVTCRGLVMPGATAWLDAPYQILVLSSSVGLWWSLLLDIRCLWRHNRTSYSRLQTIVLAKFFDTTCILGDAGAGQGQQ